MSRPVVARTQLSAQHGISRIIKGGWQLAGGHGHVKPEQAINDMLLYVQAGITTFDCADIYTGVEERIGRFLSRHCREMNSGELPRIQVHTKYVPDLGALPSLGQADVERAIDRSLRRLGVECLDLVQFHWWDYEIPGYVEAAVHLHDLQRTAKIRHVGLTNFDVARMAEIVNAGVRVVANQVQYSVLDRRPESAIVRFCARHGIALLCYGTLAGGLLSDRYLGAPRPEPPYENRSLTKYMLIVDEFGGWDLFQELLAALHRVGVKHDVSIAAVATRWVLQRPGAAAAIVGARHAGHLSDTLRIFDFALDDEDMASIESVAQKAQGPLGAVYALERVKGGQHAAIMKYNLSEA